MELTNKWYFYAALKMLILAQRIKGAGKIELAAPQPNKRNK